MCEVLLFYKLFVMFASGRLVVLMSGGFVFIVASLAFAESFYCVLSIMVASADYSYLLIYYLTCFGGMWTMSPFG